jgi:hypothetical protein
MNPLCAVCRNKPALLSFLSRVSAVGAGFIKLQRDLPYNISTAWKPALHNFECELQPCAHCAWGPWTKAEPAVSHLCTAYLLAFAARRSSPSAGLEYLMAQSGPFASAAVWLPASCCWHSHAHQHWPS